MEELYSKVLAEELGRLGGRASKFVARFLSNVPYETTMDIAAPPDDVRTAAAAVLSEIGYPNAALPELSAVCGSGHANLNPTIVSIVVSPSGAGSRVTIHAVAKEGLIKQATAKKAVERVKELLEQRCR